MCFAFLVSGSCHSVHIWKVGFVDIYNLQARTQSNDPGPRVTKKFHVKINLVNRNFRTWLLIGGQYSCQLIRSHFRTSLSADMDFFNSLVPGKFEWNFRHAIFKQILVIDCWGISCEIALLWMSLDFTDDQSTLVQVMAWCHQATSHYLSQCWPRSLLPYGITRPQWVNMDFTW